LRTDGDHFSYLKRTCQALKKHIPFMDSFFME
jgi:hypothetical protein